MTRSVEVIVPFRGRCPHRERAWAWCRKRYTWPVTLAEGPSGAWCKARATMPAVEDSCASIVVLADADVWSDGIGEAIAAVAAGAAWAQPHRGVHRLTEEGTEALLRGDSWEDQPLTQPAYRGTEGGGIVVMRRETALEVPLDPRFV